MAVLIVIIIFVLIGVVVLVVGAPLRRAAAAPELAAGDAALEREEAARGDQLEAAREAKYREIRDAEMDFRTGKLSEADYRLLDAELRAEALEILDGLQTLRGEERPEER
ncbi:MAG: hypothetical protein QOK19_1060 [Solirubrobacteraceae bacterium]|nr:hypothetical protein [Solirubrobacterales bacterium]MEA2215499.1 hypothetical protein [Solirubrobacteraceae bacterium]